MRAIHAAPQAGSSAAERWPYNSSVAEQASETPRSLSPLSLLRGPIPPPSVAPWQNSVTEFGRMDSAAFELVGRLAADAALGAYLGVMALGLAGMA
jgi:hypothetical protein